MTKTSSLGASSLGVGYGGKGGRGTGVTWNKPKRALLTDSFVESLPRPPADKRDYWMRDPRIPGFSVRVYQPDEHGEIPKVFGYTFAIDGKEKYFRIGQFGIMTATKAREEAQKINQNIRDKKDPFAHRQPVSLTTVKDLFEDWKSHFWPKGLAKSTRERYQRFWDRFIPKSFKSLQLSQVAMSHIQDIQEKVSKGGIEYTRRRKVNFVKAESVPSDIQANRVISMLSGMFKYQLGKESKHWQGLEHNPCRAIPLEPESEDFVYLGREDQLRLRAFLESETSRCKPHSRSEEQFAGIALDAIDLIFHTGLRHREALRLSWGAVDFELGLLKFAVTKTGAKRPRVKRTKYIRMTSPARALLVRLWEAAGRPKAGWVFPGYLDPEKPWSNIQDTWEAIRGLLHLPEETRLHDLRHTMATDLLRSGLERGEVQHYMGWVSLDSANRYMHVVSKDTHMKAEVIIATRGIGQKDPEDGQASTSVRSRIKPQAKGMLQTVVDQAREVLSGLYGQVDALPPDVKTHLKALRVAFNPDLAGEDAWTPEEQFEAASKATILVEALFDEEADASLKALPEQVQGSVNALLGQLRRLGLMEA